MPFRFRLSRVLDWFERQYQLEAGRLRQFAEKAATAHRELARHRESRLANELQTLRLESLQGNDFRARESWRAAATLKESHLIMACRSAEKDLDQQRLITLAAQRKMRLVEKLRDRKRDEFDYLAARELEEIGADSHLAGFARNLAGGKDLEIRHT
jgi:hypothetical protein